MKTKNVMRSLFVVVLTIFISNNYVFGAQWQGPDNTTSSIERTGSVGIGTTSPTTKLHIKESNSTTNPNLRIENSKGNGIHVGYNTGGDYGALSSNIGGTNHWDTLVWKDGRVGIGTQPWQMTFTNGTFKPVLTIRGDVRLETVQVWDGPDEYDLTWCRGADSGISYAEDLKFITREGSSLRYKKDIEPLDENFSKLLNVSPKRYRMQEGFGPKDAWNYGYIAEDLDKAGLRNLVIYDEKGRPDGVKYKKIVIYINEVVKIQQKRIDQLEADIAELKKVVNGLKK